MGGRGAVSSIKTSIGMGGRNSATIELSPQEIKAFNDELGPNSSNKQVRDLFIKKFGDADVEYGLVYSNGKATSIVKGQGSAVVINSKRGEGTLHNHPVDRNIGAITGLGLSYADVSVGSYKGEKMSSITTRYNDKVVKQSISYGKNFDRANFLRDAANNKVLMNEYQIPKGWTLSKTQKALFQHQDKWLSNVKNQIKYGYSYYSTLNK